MLPIKGESPASKENPRCSLVSSPSPRRPSRSPSRSSRPPPSATDVCNEAENSWQGGYTVNGGPVDPNPPAFLRGSQMRVGNGNGKGLVNAADALAGAAHLRPHRRRRRRR